MLPKKEAEKPSKIKENLARERFACRQKSAKLAAQTKTIFNEKYCADAHPRKPWGENAPVCGLQHANPI
jgi:hypothetical protein